MSGKYTSTKIASYTGYFIQAIICNLAPILYVTFQNSFGLSYSQISTLAVVNMATQMVVDIISMKFVDRFGYRRCVLVAHVCAAVGLIMLASLPNLLPMPYLWLILATVIYAAGSGLVEVLINPIVAALPRGSSPAQMNFLHSFYCWGQVGTVLVSTLLMRLFGAEHWFIVPLIWAVVPICNFFTFTKVPIIEPQIEAGERMSIGELMKKPQFVLIAAVMVCAGAGEMAMSQWASLFAERSLQVDKVLGDLLGPCMFAVLMGSGRILYGLFGSKIPVKRVLLFSSALCVVSYVTAALAPLPIVSLIGCALCGLSVSVMWPGTVSIAANKFANGGTAMFGLLAMFGDIGCASGPAIVGFVSDLVGGANLPISGLQVGLLCGIIFPAVMLILLLIDRKK